MSIIENISVNLSHLANKSKKVNESDTDELVSYLLII
jgi:hypothetical protein